MLEDPKLNVAVIAAFASLATALVGLCASLVSVYFTRNTQLRVETLKADLENAKLTQNARRDYEYEARKRLYSECDPAAFRMLEESERAHARIVALAQVARAGEAENWIANPENRSSTLYRILAPLAAFATLREKLTLFDLSLEPRLHLQYRLGSLMVDTFHHDVDMARAGVSMDYDPEGAPKSGEPAIPQVYLRQGISHENLDSALAALLEEADEGRRLITYPKFRSLAASDESAVHEAELLLDYLLRDFTPMSRPILWRLLLAEAVLCQTVIKASAAAAGTRQPNTLLISPDENRELKALLQIAEDDPHLPAVFDFLNPRLARIEKALTFSTA